MKTLQWCLTAMFVMVGFAGVAHAQNIEGHVMYYCRAKSQGGNGCKKRESKSILAKAKKLAKKKCKSKGYTKATSVSVDRCRGNRKNAVLRLKCRYLATCSN